MEITTVNVSEARPWLACLWQALLGDPYGDEFPRSVRSRERDWRADRTWGVRDGGRWVATLATQPRTLTVPGTDGGTNDLEVDALTAVSVAATHRRQGLLTRMITGSLSAAHARGDAASVLIAAEWPIYGRFGYAPVADAATCRYFPRRPGATITAGGPGRIRQVDPEQLAAIAPAVFDSARRRVPGQIDRRAPWWDRRLGLDGHETPRDSRMHWLLHEGADGPDGLLAWKAKRDVDLSGRLGMIEVGEFVAATDAAYRDMWAYLGGIDGVEEIELDDRPLAEPVRWLLPDARALRTERVFDYLWLRLLDVPAALRARHYARPGKLVLDVVDDDLGHFAAGRFALTVAVDGTATCAATDAAPDVRLSQRALAGAYLGGQRLRERAIVGDTIELTRGALPRLELTLGTATRPWNATGF